MISEPLYSDEFVGRRGELDFLREEFRVACDSRARFVIIEGEAGIGKSRLVREFVRGVLDDASVATGHCSEHVRSPYLPFIEIAEHLDPRARLSAFTTREPGSLPDEKWAYFNTVAGMVRTQAARRPAVIIIEDTQWSDNASGELLQFLLQRLHAARLLAIVTMRSEMLPQNPAAALLRSAASRMRAATVQLHPLSRAEMKHLVQSSLSARSNNLDAATIARIESLAEGNPLFAEELSRVAHESGSLSFQSRLPVTLQALLSERLGPFSDDERSVLVRAAILGQTFDAALLSAIASQPLDDVLAVMERAVRSGLLYEEHAQATRFSFRHALIRQALADQLIFALAAPLHIRIAQELEVLPRSREREAELAYHWSAARVGARARVWNEAAAESAWQMHAYRDAIRFYTEALRWEYPPGTARARVFERLGMLFYIDGCGEEPARWFAMAREEYERCGNDVGAAHAQLLLADQSWVDARTHESVRAGLEASATLQRLGHSQMYAQALLSVARFSITLGQIERARAHLAAAQPLHSHFDLASRASWHEVRGETFAVTGDTASAFAEFRAAARLGAQTGVSELISQIENNFALAAFDLGDLDLAVARHQIAVDEAERTGLTWRVGYSSLNYARTLTYRGELERARAHVWKALNAGVTTATFKTKAASVGILLALMLNDHALLEACADDSAVALAQQSGEIQRVASVSAAFAALRIAQGNAAEARALMGKALRSITHAHRAWDLFASVALWGRPEDVTLARALLDTAPGRPRVKRAYRFLFDAITAAKTGESQASRLGALAARHFERMGNILCKALALEAAGDRDAAIDVFGAIGAVRDSARLAQSVRPEPSRLTPRQSEIADLVATGETNRSIADRLGISEHTVEHHVSAIFARLGLKSRAQLAHMLGQSVRI